MQVFHNPTYRGRETSARESDSENEDSSKKRTVNHYETEDPAPVYETIDDNLYEKVNEEKVKDQENSGTRKKSRSNPIYDVGRDEDSLNPVASFAVTSLSRKALKKDGQSFPLIVEDNDSDNSLSTPVLKGHSNPLASQSDSEEAKSEVNDKPVISVSNELHPQEHESSFEETSDGDKPLVSPPPVHNNSELYSLEQGEVTFGDADDSVC